MTPSAFLGPQHPDPGQPGRLAQHGYALIKDIEDFAGVKLGAGTLYSPLAKLDQAGLVEALPPGGRGGAPT